MSKKHREMCWIILKEPRKAACPRRQEPYFAITTLRWTRRDAIDAFLDKGIATGVKMEMSWREAKKFYGVRVVKVLLTEVVG